MDRRESKEMGKAGWLIRGEIGDGKYLTGS